MEVMGLIERIKAEAKAEAKAKAKVEGIAEGRKIIINRILEFHSLKETADFLRMDESEIIHILEK